MIAKSVRKVGKFAGFSARTRERFARSFGVFLIGVVIACGIEVAADWHQTLFEVRMLHDRIRERGRNYVAVLVHPLGAAVASKREHSVERLVDGVFADQDVVFVRVVGDDGAVVFERIDPEFANEFSKSRGATFDAYYAHQLERDTTGVLTEPEALRKRMEGSRHRDFAQSYYDFLVRLHVMKPDPERVRKNEIILFQDRLYTTNKTEHDDAVTYAIGRLEADDGHGAGVVIVGFDMRATNRAIRTKYLKGAGLVVFFVLLILVQNVTSRREKLRVLELEAKYGTAKESIRTSLPEPMTTRELRISGAISQSVDHVDGMFYEVTTSGDGTEIVVVDPEGEGIEAAAAALHLRATYRQRREQGIHARIREELEVLGDAAMRIPGKRPIGVILLRIDQSRVTGVRCGMSSVHFVAKGEVVKLREASPSDDVPAGVVGPLVAFDGEIPDRGLLLVSTNGLGGRRLDHDGVASFVARAHKEGDDLAALADDAGTWARGSSTEIARDDVVIVVAERSA